MDRPVILEGASIDGSNLRVEVYPDGDALIDIGSDVYIQISQKMLERIRSIAKNLARTAASSSSLGKDSAEVNKKPAPQVMPTVQTLGKENQTKLDAAKERRVRMAREAARKAALIRAKGLKLPCIKREPDGRWSTYLQAGGKWVRKSFASRQAAREAYHESIRHSMGS